MRSSQSLTALVSSGAFNLQKTSLARALGGTGNRAYNGLVIERILQKLMFNQIYFENLGLTGEEAEFLEMIAGIRATSDGRKKVFKLVKETANTKLTDYL